MLVPLITAVPLVAVSGPPLLARRAPGSRVFLNCCSFMAPVGEGIGAPRWLIVLFGMPFDVVEPI